MIDTEAARIETALEALLAEHDPTTESYVEFRGHQFDAGLAWVYLPEGNGGLGVSPQLQRTVNRRLAEAALQYLSPFFPGLSQPWTATSQLPGGNFAWNGADELADDLRRRYPFLSAATAVRMTRAYGTEAHDVLGDARSEADLGACFGADLTAREVDWMAGAEWARTADDVLWRRSKLGLRLTAAGAEALAHHLARR